MPVRTEPRARPQPRYPPPVSVWSFSTKPPRLTTRGQSMRAHTKITSNDSLPIGDAAMNVAVAFPRRTVALTQTRRHITCAAGPRRHFDGLLRVRYVDNQQ